MYKQPEPDFLAIGRILRPHGVHGEVRVEMLTDFPDRWAELKSVFLGSGQTELNIDSSRHHKNTILLKFKGYESRDDVEPLRGELLYISMDEAMPLESDEFYLYQVIGLEVKTENGQILGEIVDVLKPPNANEVFVVHGVRGEILIPVIEDVIRSLDLVAGEVIIDPIPGLLPDD